MFACPAVKTGVCFSLCTRYTTKRERLGDGGVKEREREIGREGALMFMFGHKQLSLIIVFLFSFPVLMEVPARPTSSNPASLKRPSGPHGAARPWDSRAFISMWVWSWFKHRAMGELTPKPWLSMGSAKRLYVLMAGLLYKRLYVLMADLLYVLGFKRNFC